MYEVFLMNMRHRIIERIITFYDYHVGEIVYPFELREKYPGYNENRHKVCSVRYIGR